MKDGFFLWVTVFLSVMLFAFLAWLSWDDWISRPTLNSNIQAPRRGTADPVLVGAGDISICKNDFDEQTAKLLDVIPGTVFTLGDNVYPDGRAEEFAECYEATWGRHKDRTYPVVGNHEYQTEKAADYFAYFGARAGQPSQGYYRYQLDGWQVYVLNSNCGEIGGCGLESDQYAWLQSELANHPSRCAVAMMHHPPFSSALHGNTKDVQTLWQALVTGGVDVVLAGHDHSYERFAPLNTDGQIDELQGTRAIVVGTGGRSLYAFRTIQTGSEVRNSKTYGVLKLTLHPDAYSWEFVPVAGETFKDSGLQTCR